MSLKSEIRSFVVENFLFGDAGDFQDSDSFLDKGLIDSTGILELVAFAEQEYGIDVDDEDLIPSNLDSVNNLAAYIDRKRED